MFRKKKVYCSQCRFLDGINYDYSDVIKGCGYPENLKRKNTPLAPIFTAIKGISQLNKNNDCPWFKLDND